MLISYLCGLLDRADITTPPPPVAREYIACLCAKMRLHSHSINT